MIRTANLTFSYDLKRTILFPSFSLNRSEHCLLLGESGSGKTTLLHLLGGLLRGYSGNLQVNGMELSTLSETELDTFSGKNIGFIFQKNHLISALSVEQNLFMAPYLAGLTVDKIKAQKVLTTLGIEEKMKSAVTEISQGQAQRVAIARAILNQPPIILADEPTSALDDRSCERVINLLLRIADSNQSTLVVATHDQRLKDKISNQILLNS